MDLVEQAGREDRLQRLIVGALAAGRLPPNPVASLADF
jgi:hypothetical protein